LVPLYPYGQRRTLRQEVVKDTIWTFDQLQGILYVVVPIRMTVVRLNAGGLLVYAPIAPTPECIRLVQELVTAHGDVKYIILPTVSGLEHKVFVGPFARRFSKAQVFVAPDQWSFPLNLPLSWLGFPAKRTVVLPPDSMATPFADEFDYATLGPIALGLGPFSEVAFFHKRSRTLLVTDMVISIPAEPPAIAQLDPYPLLYHARDHASEVVVDSPTNRRKGWQRIVLFALYFRPSALEIVKLQPSIRDARQAPDRSAKAFWGWYPYQWAPDWQRSFETIRGGGRLLVAPILQTLILNRNPRSVIAWANQVAHWEFQQMIPCHFDAPILAHSRQFRQAFTFLEAQPSVSAGLGENGTPPLPDADLELLRAVEATLIRRGITPPPQGRW
jgi:hypothetical protein